MHESFRRRIDEENHAAVRQSHTVHLGLRVVELVSQHSGKSFFQDRIADLLTRTSDDTVALRFQRSDQLLQKTLLPLVGCKILGHLRQTIGRHSVGAILRPLDAVVHHGFADLSNFFCSSDQLGVFLIEHLVEDLDDLLVVETFEGHLALLEVGAHAACHLIDADTHTGQHRLAGLHHESLVCQPLTQSGHFLQQGFLTDLPPLPRREDCFDQLLGFVLAHLFRSEVLIELGEAIRQRLQRVTLPGLIHSLIGPGRELFDHIDRHVQTIIDVRRPLCTEEGVEHHHHAIARPDNHRRDTLHTSVRRTFHEARRAQVACQRPGESAVCGICPFGVGDVEVLLAGRHDRSERSKRVPDFFQLAASEELTLGIVFLVLDLPLDPLFDLLAEAELQSDGLRLRSGSNVCDRAHQRVTHRFLDGLTHLAHEQRFDVGRQALQALAFETERPSLDVDLSEIAPDEVEVVLLEFDFVVRQPIDSIEKLRQLRIGIGSLREHCLSRAQVFVLITQTKAFRHPLVQSASNQTSDLVRNTALTRTIDGNGQRVLCDAAFKGQGPRLGVEVDILAEAQVHERQKLCQLIIDRSVCCPTRSEEAAQFRHLVRQDVRRGFVQVALVSVALGEIVHADRV